MDTVSTDLSLAGVPLAPLGSVTNIRNTEALIKDQRNVGDIQSANRTMVGLLNYFPFGNREYYVILNIARATGILIASHKNLGNMVLNYQKYRKILERLKDVYTLSAEMRWYFPFFSFRWYGLLSTLQLCNIHWYIGHLSVVHSIRMIETDDIVDVPESTWKQIVKYAMHCQVFQHAQRKPSQFFYHSLTRLQHSLIMFCSWTWWHWDMEAFCMSKALRRDSRIAPSLVRWAHKQHGEHCEGSVLMLMTGQRTKFRQIWEQI